MPTYSATGHTVATVTSNDMIACLWNPNSVKDLLLVEISLFRNGQNGTRPTLRRTTTRGTPGSTVTPGASNCMDDLVAPSSGALVDVAAYSAQPTLSTPPLTAYGGMTSAAGTEGQGFLWRVSVKVPPLSGVGITAPGGTVFDISDVNFVWFE